MRLLDQVSFISLVYSHVTNARTARPEASVGEVDEGDDDDEGRFFGGGLNDEQNVRGMFVCIVNTAANPRYFRQGWRRRR